MSGWDPGEVRVLPVDAFGLRYRRYRLPDAEAEAAMARSLERYGQVAPVVVCLREEAPEVLDGFKRLTAARVVPGMRSLSARLLAADERAAKAAIYGLNRGGRPVQELEEAWVVHALVREDGLTQVEAAELLESDFGVAADVWSVTSFTELRREGLEVERWNRLHPLQEPRQAYVSQELSDAPVVASTDYIRAFADQIRQWVPGRYCVLGTDGYGRSDSRRALRRFFEVDRHHVVVAALRELDPGRAAEAITRYEIDPEAPMPTTV